MTRFPNLQALVQIIGPRFAEHAAERDADDIFVAENYDVLKEHRVFSALVPTELGGGVCATALCVPSYANLRIIAPQRLWRCRCISILWLRQHITIGTAGPERSCWNG